MISSLPYHDKPSRWSSHSRLVARLTFLFPTLLGYQFIVEAKEAMQKSEWEDVEGSLRRV